MTLFSNNRLQDEAKNVLNIYENIQFKQGIKNPRICDLHTINITQNASQVGNTGILL